MKVIGTRTFWWPELSRGNSGRCLKADNDKDDLEYTSKRCVIDSNTGISKLYRMLTSVT